MLSPSKDGLRPLAATRSSYLSSLILPPCSFLLAEAYAFRLKRSVKSRQSVQHTEKYISRKIVVKNPTDESSPSTHSKKTGATEGRANPLRCNRRAGGDEARAHLERHSPFHRRRSSH